MDFRSKELKPIGIYCEPQDANIELRFLLPLILKKF